MQVSSLARIMYIRETSQNLIRHTRGVLLYS